MATEMVSAKASERTKLGDYPHSSPTSVVSDGDADTAWYSIVANGDYFVLGGAPPVFILDQGFDRGTTGFVPAGPDCV